jgi:hypothetical protein
MDVKFIPKHLREMLTEILEYSLNTLRNFYVNCAEIIIGETSKNKYENIYELGAGNAKLSEHLSLKAGDKIKIIPCDLNPKINHLKILEENSLGRIKPIYKPVDIKHFNEKSNESIVVFSASFHHISKEEQIEILKHLKNRAKKIMIFEPLCKNAFSIFSTVSLLLPLFAFPIFKPKPIHFFWCWIIPIAGLLFVWDGIVTSLRQNNKKEWKEIFSKAGIDKYEINIGITTQAIFIN